MEEHTVDDLQSARDVVLWHIDALESRKIKFCVRGKRRLKHLLDLGQDQLCNGRGLVQQGEFSIGQDRHREIMLGEVCKHRAERRIRPSVAERGMSRDLTARETETVVDR